MKEYYQDIDKIPDQPPKQRGSKMNDFTPGSWEVKERKGQLAEIAELQEKHSDTTKAMFTEFVRMYREIQTMKINPEWLARTWKI